MIPRKIVQSAWLIMRKLLSENNKVGLNIKNLDIFKESSLVSQEAYLVILCLLLQYVFVCVNENQHVKAVVLGFLKGEFSLLWCPYHQQHKDHLWTCSS